MAPKTRSSTRRAARAADKLGAGAAKVSKIFSSLAKQGVSVIISPPDAPRPVPPHLVGLYNETPPDGLTGPDLARYYSWGSDLTDIDELERKMGIYQEPDTQPTTPTSPQPSSSQPPHASPQPLRRVAPFTHLEAISAPCSSDMTVDEYCSPRDIENYPDAQWTTIPSKNGDNPICRITLVPNDLSEAARNKAMCERDYKAWGIAKQQILRLFRSAKMTYQDVIAFAFDDEVKEELQAHEQQIAILLPGQSKVDSASGISSSSTLVRQPTEILEFPPVDLKVVSNRFLNVTEVPVQIIDGNFSTKYTDGIDSGGCWDASEPKRIPRTDTDMIID